MRATKASATKAAGRRGDRGDLPLMTVVVMLLGTALVTMTTALVGLAGRAVPAQARSQAYDAAVHLAKGALNDFYGQLELNPGYFDAGSTPWDGADGKWYSFGPSGQLEPCADQATGLSGPTATGCWQLSVSESKSPTSAGAPGPAGPSTQSQEAVTAVAKAYTDCHGTLSTCTAAEVVQHFERKDFLDYLYFTDQDIVDPAFVANQPAICSNQAACSEPAYVTGDVIDGPVHTNSPQVWVCGDPVFKGVVEATGDPVLEPTDAPHANCGTPPSADTVPNAPDLPLPSGDRYLGQLAGQGGDPWSGQAGYGFVGSITVVATGSTLDITYDGTQHTQVPFPSTGVVYASGDIYLSGTVKGQVTFAAGSNVYLTGSLTYACSGADGQPSAGCQDYTGIEAGGSVLIEDPGTAGGGTPVVVDAAMVALHHSVSIDPQDLAACSGTCPTLTIWGAMASEYRGVFGTYDPEEVPPPPPPSTTTTTTAPGSTSTTSSTTTTTTTPPPPTYVVHYAGFSKDFHYDPRLFHNSPPWLLSDQTGGWEASGQVVTAGPVPLPTTTTTTTAPTTTTTTQPAPVCPANPTTTPVPGEPWIYEADNYGGLNGNGGVAVVNPTNSVVSQLPNPPGTMTADGYVGYGSSGDVVASPNGAYVYAGYGTDMAVPVGVQVVSTATNTVVRTINVGAASLAISPDGTYLYALGYPSGAPSTDGPSGDLTIYKIDAATGEVAGSVELGSNDRPGAINSLAVSPDGTTLYAIGYDVKSGGGLFWSIATSDMAVNATTDLSSEAPNNIALSPDGATAYVTTSGPALVVLSTSDDEVVRTLNKLGSDLSTTAAALTVAPDGTVYATTSELGAAGEQDTSYVIAVIDPTTYQLVATMPTMGPGEIGISPNGAYIYALVNDQQLGIYSTASDCEVSYAPTGVSPNAMSFPSEVALVVPTPAPSLSCPATPTTTPVPGEPYLYVDDNAGGVVVANPDNSVVAEIPNTDDGSSMVAAPDGKYVYLAQGRPVKVISTTTNSVVATIEGNNHIAWGLAVSPDSNYLYVSGTNEAAGFAGEGAVWKVSLANYQIVGEVDLGEYVQPGVPALSADGSTLYVPSAGGQEVWVFSTANLALTKTINIPPADGEPTDIAVAPSGNDIYVTTSEDDLLKVTAATGAIVATVPVPVGYTGALRSIVIDPMNDTAYVTNEVLQIFPVDLGTAVPTVGKPFTLNTDAGPLNPAGISSLAVTANGAYLYAAVASATGTPNATYIVSTQTECTMSYVPAGDTSSFWYPHLIALVPHPTLSCPSNPTSSPVPGEPWAYEADVSGASGNTSGVAVANPENKVVAQIPMSWSSGTGGYGYGSSDVVASPDGRYVYALGGVGVEVISTATHAVVSALDIGGSSLAVSPDGNYLYVSGYQAPSQPGTSSVPTVWKVDTTTYGIVGTAQFPSSDVPQSGPSSIALSPDGTTLYAIGYNNSTGAGVVWALSTSNMAVAATTTLPIADGTPEGLAVSDGEVFVTTDGNDVEVLSTATAAVAGSVDIGTSTYDTAVAPDGTVYVDGNEIWAIDPATNKVVSTIAGSDPHGMGVSSDGKYLYVAENGSTGYMTSVSETAIYSTSLGCEVSYVPAGANVSNTLAFGDPVDVALVGQPATSGGSGYNNTGISSNADPADANFDGQGDSYSAQALAAAGLTPGATVKALGFSFTWPDVPANTPDNWEADGQTIPLSLPAGTLRLGILGAETSQSTPFTATINYTDGTSSTVTVNFPNWTTNDPPRAWLPSGVGIVATTPYRNPAGASSPLNTYVLATEVPVNPTKTVASITLPNTLASAGQVHIFAFAGSTTGAPYDATAVSTASDPGEANYDGYGDSYSASALSAAGLSPGASFSAQGAQMTWPDAAPGQPDYWSVPDSGSDPDYGPVLPAPAMPSGAKSLVVVGSVANNPVNLTTAPASAVATLLYSDNTTQTVSIGLSAWTLGVNSTGNLPVNPSYNNTVVAKTASMDCARACPVSPQTSTYVFATSLPLLPGKTLVAVALPSSVANGAPWSFGIFAMGGSTQAATGAPVIFSQSPAPVAPGQQVTINGAGFGPKGGYVSVFDATEFQDYVPWNGSLDITSWSNTAITFVVPSTIRSSDDVTVNVHLANGLSTGRERLSLG